jgi:hypothetical protein
MVSVEVAGNNDTGRPMLVLCGSCDGALNRSESWQRRCVIASEKWYWRYVDRKEKYLRVSCPDLDGCDIWVVA